MALKVTFGETRIASMSTGVHWAPGLSTMQDGSLHLSIGVYPDAMRKSVANIIAITLRSEDGGRNWKLHREHRPPHGHGREVEHQPLRDGTVLELPFHLDVKGPGKIVAQTYRSHDRGRTFTEFFEAPVEFPEGLEPLNEDMRGNTSTCIGREEATVVFFGPIVELEKGDLLATLYGTLRNDKAARKRTIRGGYDRPIMRYQELKTKIPAKKDQTVVVCSRDKGESWRYLSTVAHDPRIEGDGFEEPAMVMLKNGELLCVLRTASGGPLYQTRSRDMGVTWSKPNKVGFNGVAPNLVVLENGVVACSFGRPGNHLILSTDKGESWSYHKEIFSTGYLWTGPLIPGHALHPGTVGYTGLTEMKGNTLLYAYDHLGVIDLRTKELSLMNCIKTVEVKVELK